MGAVSYDPSTHPLTDLRHPGTHLLNLVHLPVTLRGAPHWWIADVGCSSKSSCTPFPLWSGDNLGAAQGLICGGHVGFVRPRVLWPPAGSVGLPEGFEVPQECCVVYFRVMEEAEKRRIEAMAVEAAAAERGAAGGFGEAAAEAASSSERDGDGFLRSLPGWWQLCVRTSQWARVQSALSAAPSDAEVTAAMLAARERGGGAGGSTSDRFFRFAPARQPTRAVVAAILREMSRPEWTVPVPGHAGLLCRAATDGGRAVMVGTRAGGYKCVVRSWAGAEVDRFEIGGGRVWRGKKKDAAREEAEEEAEAARGEDVDVPRRNFELFKALAKQVFGVEGLDAGDV
ncbi:hypothetical protein DFJ73DRAFT_146368 [Zopfochytrium polystomum]|nr:hypothetical protein DFJ73DRAFT_146368 [Zopfochytrium polystomum]